MMPTAWHNNEIIMTLNPDPNFVLRDNYPPKNLVKTPKNVLLTYKPNSFKKRIV